MDDITRAVEILKIHELLYRYTQCVDRKDPASWAQCFCEDGAFVSGDRAIRGRDKLTAYGEVHSTISTRHLTTSPVYTIEPSGTVAHGYATTVVLGATPLGYKIFFIGYYIDVLHKIDGNWLLFRRRADPELLPDQPDIFVPTIDPEVAKLSQRLFDAWARLGEPITSEEPG